MGADIVVAAAEVVGVLITVTGSIFAAARWIFPGALNTFLLNGGGQTVRLIVRDENSKQTAAQTAELDRRFAQHEAQEQFRFDTHEAEDKRRFETLEERVFRER